MIERGDAPGPSDEAPSTETRFIRLGVGKGLQFDPALVELLSGARTWKLSEIDSLTRLKDKVEGGFNSTDSPDVPPISQSQEPPIK